MNQIEPYPVWVGHAGDGRAAKELVESGIQAVVQLAIEEPPLSLPRDLIVLRLPLLDGAGNEPTLLRFCIQAVAILITQRVPTLVCCGGGMSRAPSIAAAALAVAEDRTLEDCLATVARFRPMDVSPGLLVEIRAALDE